MSLCLGSDLRGSVKGCTKDRCKGTRAIHRLGSILVIRGIYLDFLTRLCKNLLMGILGRFLTFIKTILRSFSNFIKNYYCLWTNMCIRMKDCMRIKLKKGKKGGRSFLLFQQRFKKKQENRIFGICSCQVSVDCLIRNMLLYVKLWEGLHILDLVASIVLPLIQEIWKCFINMELKLKKINGSSLY